MSAESTVLSTTWGGTSIEFTLRRGARRTMRITVAPNGAVAVLAPGQASDEDVITRVARRGGWILRQRREFDRWRPRTPPRRYVTGETHLYLGRQYRLKVESAVIDWAGIQGDRIIVALPRPDDNEHCRAILDNWYAQRCREVLPGRLTLIAPAFSRLGVGQPRLIIRRMDRRWGSYTSAGNLVLNRDLVRASPHLIDYVIAHELAHSLHPNHGSEWEAVLVRIMPDWEKRKAALERQLT